MPYLIWRTVKICEEKAKMRISLSFIVCFQVIQAGFRESLSRHEVTALSDYVLHQVSYSLNPILIANSLNSLFQRLERLNLNAILSQSHESKEINHGHDELKSREKENLEVFNALQNMFKDLELD